MDVWWSRIRCLLGQWCCCVFFFSSSLCNAEYAYKYHKHTKRIRWAARKNKTIWKFFAHTTIHRITFTHAATVIQVESVHRYTRHTHALLIDIIHIFVSAHRCDNIHFGCNQSKWFWFISGYIFFSRFFALCFVPTVVDLFFFCPESQFKWKHKRNENKSVSEIKKNELFRNTK